MAEAVESVAVISSVVEDSEVSVEDEYQQSEDTLTIEGYADMVCNKILRKDPRVAILIANSDGQTIRSNMEYLRAEEASSSVFTFTDKVRVFMKKIFPNEPLERVTLHAKKNEIVVSFDQDFALEILTIQPQTGI